MRRVILTLEVDPVGGPQFAHEGDGLAQPGEAFLELGPVLRTGSAKAGCNFVEGFASADPDHDPARVEASEGRKSLREHSRVVAERRRHYRGTDLDRRGALADRRHPSQRERCMTAGMAPGLEMVTHRDAFKTMRLRRYGDLHQLTRFELLCGCLVTEFQGKVWCRHGARFLRTVRITTIIAVATGRVRRT